MEMVVSALRSKNRAGFSFNLISQSPLKFNSAVLFDGY